MPVDSQALVDRIRAGDPAGMAMLAEAFGPRLRRLAAGMLGEPAEAEDAAQDALLAAWRGIAGFRDGTDLGAWLATLCLNACRLRLRGRARERRALEEVARRGQEAAPPPDPEATERRDALFKALGGLPEREREAFLLMVVEGWTSAQAGEALGCSAEATRVYLGRAREALAERLQRYLE